MGVGDGMPHNPKLVAPLHYLVRNELNKYKNVNCTSHYTISILTAFFGSLGVKI